MLKKLGKILNISRKEMPRVIVAWSMMFFMRFGFIVGWSVLIATFLSKVGINFLPALFLINAILVMLGTSFFRSWVKRVQREVLISFTVITAAAALVASIIFINTNVVVFFGLLLIAESVLLAQLQILLSLFNEDLFTPLESQRTFPIIESAETIGAIAGGVMLSFFAELVPAYKFILLWAIVLIMILPIVLFFNPKTLNVPKLVGIKAEESMKKKRFRETFKTLKRIPFLKMLMIVVVLHWGMMNMIEYQYTKAIQQEVFEVHEETLVEDNSQMSIVLATEGYSQAQSEQYEQKLTKKLGTLHAMFNAAALLIQLLVASRLMQVLGIIPSMLIHPIASLLNIIALTLKFNIGTAILTRGSYEITGSLFKNSYDSAYYAIPHQLRDEAKEMIQGIMKPLGAILGTILIIIIALNSTGASQTAILNAVLLVFSIVFIFAGVSLRKEYTALSEHNLSRKMDLPTRLNAIEILAQNGHRKFTPSLLKILGRETEPEIIRVNILKALGERQSPESVNAIMDMIESGNDSLRLEAVKALKAFTEEKDLMKQSFTAYRLISGLQKALEKEKNETIREHLVKCFYDFSPKALTDFLITKITEKDKHRDVYIRMLKMFDDSNLKYFLEPFLNDKNPKVRAASIIALWQFEDKRTELKHFLRQMLDSNKQKTKVRAIKACGEVKFKASKPFLKADLKAEESEVVEASIISLGQLGDERVIPMIVERFVDLNHSWHGKVDSIMKRFSYKFEQRIRQELKANISKQITDIINKHQHVSDMDERTLKELRRLYHKLNAHHEAHQIKLVLDSDKSK